MVVGHAGHVVRRCDNFPTALDKKRRTLSARVAELGHFARVFSWFISD